MARRYGQDPFTDRQSRVESIRAQAASLLAEAERLANLPVDEHEDGSILTFEKIFGGRSERPYTYAAIKANGGWYLTGTEGDLVRSPMTYEQLLQFATGPIWRVTALELEVER